jgi:hypothetical protein
MRSSPQKSLFFLFTIIVLIPLILIKIPITYSSPTQILVSPNSRIVNVGNNFSININLADPPEFAGFELNLAYDPLLLNVTSVTVNLPWSFTGYVLDEDAGTVYIYGWNLEQPLVGSHTLATVIFYAEKMGNTTLDLYNTHLYDKNTNEIPHEALDGYAEILGILDLAAKTDKQAYYFLDSVSVYGNVTMEHIPINNSLVAIEIDSQQGPLLFRTTTTSAPPTKPVVEIISVTPCDDQGNPKSSFTANGYAYFNVTVKNNIDETIQTLETVTAFDHTGAPFGYSLYMGPLSSGGVTEWIAQIFIPSSAPAGTAKAYASVFSDFPRSNGTALCPEKSATFQVLSGRDMPFPNVSQTPMSPGNFNYTFRLGLYGGLGNYNVYVTSLYKIQSDNWQSSFSTALLGDFDGDGHVGLKDYYLFARAYGRSSGDPNYFPAADFNNDGKIGLYDFYRFMRNYGLSV